MAVNLTDSSLSAKTPFYQLITSIIVIVVVGGLLFVVLAGAGIMIFNTETDMLKDPGFLADQKDIVFLRYLLISQHISLFIIPGLYLIYRLRPADRSFFIELKKPFANEVLYVIILAFCLFPVIGFTGEINSGMNLPEWLSGLEQWMRRKEDFAEKLIEAMLTPDDLGSFWINFIMVAIIPAIGEELIFRGIFQRILHAMLRSGHLAVLITAFFFSALHFQFYGFIPRFILGVVFGYLFLWSGTLWLPVIAHFTNNAVSLIMVYTQSPDSLFIQKEIPLWKEFAALLLPIIIGGIIMFYFRRNAISKSLKL